jgi:hypothetical protein
MSQEEEKEVFFNHQNHGNNSQDSIATMEDSPSKKRKVTSWYWKYVSEQIDFESTEKVNCNYCDWKGVRQNILNHFKKNHKNIFFEETQNSYGEHHIPLTKEQRTNFLHHAIA